MALLNTKYGNNQIKITTANVLEAVNEVSGKDFTVFFDKYIYGKEDVLNLKEILSKAGLIMDQFSDEVYLSRKKTNKEVLFDKIIGSKK